MTRPPIEPKINETMLPNPMHMLSMVLQENERLRLELKLLKRNINARTASRNNRLASVEITGRIDPTAMGSHAGSENKHALRDTRSK